MTSSPLHCEGCEIKPRPGAADGSRRSAKLEEKIGRSHDSFGQEPLLFTQTWAAPFFFFWAVFAF